MLRAMILIGAGWMAATAMATVVPFTEDFSADAANWRAGDEITGLDWVATGGPDGGAYASGTDNFVSAGPGDFRAPLKSSETFDSSGDALYGDWLSDGVTAVSLQVRHDAPMPLTYFARFATPVPGQGALALNFAPVLPNTWTEIVIPISPANPQFITFEASNFNTIFSNVQRLQVALEVPAALAGLDADFTFDVDKVTLVPEPATLGLMLLGLVGLRRRG